MTSRRRIRSERVPGLSHAGRAWSFPDHDTGIESSGVGKLSPHCNFVGGVMVGLISRERHSSERHLAAEDRIGLSKYGVHRARDRPTSGVERSQKSMLLWVTPAPM